MGDINKKLAKLSSTQSKALAEAMNRQYNDNIGNKKANTSRKPPSKKK